MSRLSLLFMLLTFSLFAVDGKVKVFIKPYDALYTSEKMTVNVELMSDAFSITDVRIALDSNQEFIVQAPQSAAYTSIIEIDDEKWTMLHYEFTLYPLHSGKRMIKPFDVSFTSSIGYGHPKKHFELKSQALEFEVERFEGVKDKQFVLATPSYEVSTTHKKKHQKMIVGEAIELSVTQEAQGVPDILLPPINYISNSNIRVYDKEPVLESKGEYVSRKDAFTLVTTKEGNITIPSRELLWWNTKTKTLMYEKIPGLELEIIPDPQIALDIQKELKKKRLRFVVAFVLFLTLLYLFFAKRFKAFIAENKALFKASEAGRFKVLIERLEERDFSKAYQLFYGWLLTFYPELAEGGFKGIGEKYPSFDPALKSFETLLAHNDETFDTEGFIVALKEFRTHILKMKNPENSQGLERLNP